MVSKYVSRQLVTFFRFALAYFEYLSDGLATPLGAGIHPFLLLLHTVRSRAGNNQLRWVPSSLGSMGITRRNVIRVASSDLRLGRRQSAPWPQRRQALATGPPPFAGGSGFRGGIAPYISGVEQNPTVTVVAQIAEALGGGPASCCGLPSRVAPEASGWRSGRQL